MVHVVIERDGSGLVRGFSVRGHAAAAPKGQDIVCAGVSALAQTAVLGLQRRLGVGVSVSAGAGRLACRLPSRMEPDAAQRAQDLLETVLLGFTAIGSAYPRHAAVTTVSAAPRRVRPVGRRPVRATTVEAPAAPAPPARPRRAGTGTARGPRARREDRS